MSGGVDSSVTAALLKNQGYEVIGVHMRLWNDGKENADRFGGRCCSLVDSNDARRVCDRLDIPYYVLDTEEVFKEQVVDYFVHEYLQNRTPNPCVQCNSEIKFSHLFKKADELGCYWVATGHYAQVIQDSISKIARLHKAVDPQKDQSYFLFGLTQKALTRTLMPLGGLSKVMVRKLADQFSLVNANKPDSQEICFIGDEGYKKFIEDRAAPKFRPGGMIKTLSGNVMGSHEGLFRFTIGQKKGLDLKGVKEGEEWFVVATDSKDNTVYVGAESDLYQRELFASKLNWIHPLSELKGIRCQAKIRSRSEPSNCIVTSFENHTVHVEFEEPQRAITPGQSIVFYRDDEVLGGAFIDRVVANFGIKTRSQVGKPLVQAGA